MSQVLLGYATRGLLRVCAGTRVYELEPREDGRRLIAKVFPAGGLEAEVRQEFALLESLDLDGVVRPVRLERAGDNLVMLFEHVDGRDLRVLARRQPLPLSTFLEIATQLTAIVAKLHAHGIVHRDIKPSNVSIDPDTGAVQLSNVGISSLIASEHRHLHEPETFANTLPYLSPEQSGRTARSVDARSDLYALGVTFYELLCGRLPFTVATALELLHAHLARRPTPLTEQRADLPAPLSAMIMKLLEKPPERRYQSARGLLADLEQLEQALAADETAPDFPLGRFDHADRLQFPRRLHGREQALATLEGLLVALSEGGETQQVVLVEGEAGLGKSALVQQLETPVMVCAGYLAVGAFAKDDGGLLYGGLIAAFDALFQQIITEDDDALAAWRRRLHEALGPLAPVIASLVPTLALVLGERAPPSPLAPAQTRNRLHLAFARLFRAAAEAAPLVLVIEDLQWADAASLELLAALLREIDTPALLLLTRRPSPADAELDAILPATCTRLRLEPLDQAQLLQHLTDLLARPGPEVAALAEFVGRKTGGNPLLVQQLLTHLSSLRLLEPGPEGWRWELAAIADASLPEDLLGMLAARLELLPAALRRVLCCAGHIGPRFTVELLADAADLDDQPLFAALRALEAAGLVDRDAGGFRFADVHLQAAARDFVDPAERRRLHARIGRRLLADARASRGPASGSPVPADHDDPDRDDPHVVLAASLGERLFEIVDHLDLGFCEGERTLTDDERLELAALNLAAGLRALESAEWLAARRYLEQACARLEPERARAGAGQPPTPMVFTAACAHAQAMAMVGEIDEAERAFASLADWNLARADEAELGARRVRILFLLGRFDEALAIGLAALRRCGLDVPARCSKLDVGLAVLRAWRSCRRVGADQWRARPEQADPQAAAISRLIDALETTAYLVDKNLFVVLTGAHVRVAAGAALGELSAVALAQLAIAVSVGLRKPAEAATLCDHALALCERPLIAPTRARVESSTTLFVWPASRPWREYVDLIPGLSARLAEIGDRELAGYAAVIGAAQLFVAGIALPQLLTVGHEWQAALERWGSTEMQLGCAKTLRLAALLSGELSSLDDLVSREQGLAFAASATFMTTVALPFMVAGILLGQPARAFAELEWIVDHFERDLFGSWQVARIAMWAAVVDVSRLEQGAGADERRRIHRRLPRYRKLLAHWARGSPANFGAMLEISRAELARARGRHERALTAYERARLLAIAEANPLQEGLASLRMAELARRLERPVLAHGAAAMATQAFHRWGAQAVVRRLERAWGLGPSDTDVGDGHDHTGDLFASSSTSASSSAIDLSSVLEATTLINEELHLDQVVPRVLASALTNAGADRGVLMLERDGRVRVVAEAEGGETQPRDIVLAQYGARLPMSAINYVLRTGEALVLDDTRADPRFAADPYIRGGGPRSLLCMPIIKQGRRVGALLLENHMTAMAFTRERLAVLQVVTAQAASALENARLYSALQRSEARWRSLVDGAPDTILVMDPRGQVEFCNHFADVDGDLLGDRFESLLEPELRVRWREAIAAVARQAELRELELELTLDAGTRREYLARIAPVDAEGGRLLAIITDVGRRKALEGQMRQQQRLESIGTLASGVAHEINNPIQGIMNYAELIGTQAEATPLIREFAQEINDEVERVANIVRNLLTFSRQEPEAGTEWVEAQTIVASTLPLIQALMRKDGIDLQVNLDPNLPRIRCRPQQIRQVLMNLLTNARDALNDTFPYFDERKRIELRVCVVPDAGRRWMCFSVKDLGGGIPEEIRTHIFDPFFTTKGRDKGTGLGLAVSHGIANEHAGQLTVDSEPGLGTCFRLLLPIEVPRFDLTEDLQAPASAR